MPNQLANIHDAFFKQVLGDPHLAGTFLREHLPPDDDLSVELRLRALLKALKYSRRPDLHEFLDLVLAEVPALGERDLLVILTYLDKGAAIDHKAMRETLLRLVPDRAERIMGCMTQPFYEKGMAEGKAIGEAKILTRLLEKRFGAVPSLLRERIFAADVGQIEAWVERAFDAPDLHAVFENN
jgi:hypothetical protein